MPTIFRDKVTVVNTAASVEFNDPLTKPAGAIEWGLDDMNGWDRSSEIEVVSAPIGGGADGETMGDYFPARGRHLLLGGWATAGTREDAEALRDVIMGDAFPRNTDLIITRHEAIPKYVRVRVSERREILWNSPLGFRWVVPVMSESPLKFDADPPASSNGTASVAGQSTTGFTFPLTFPLVFTQIASGSTVQSSLTVFNRGTAATSPIITLHGPLIRGGWRISNETTGEELRFDVGLDSDDILVIDFAARTAYLNDYPVTSSISGEFWRVKRGANVIKLYADYDPAASITVEIESAWE